ncbi:MAG: hypothetical protein ABWX74_18890 [Aeromicrobium sp.]
MSDVVVGILAVLAGLMLCFFGYWTMRLLLSIWGAVVGFGVGSSIATWISDDSYLVSALGWIVGALLAMVFAALAYLYYAIGVVLAFGSMGFALGAAVTAAIGVSWNWVIVLIGVAVGLALSLVAIIADVPMFLLLLLSSFGGASIVVTGLLLLTGVIDSADFDSAAVTDDIDGRWWWSVGLIGLAFAGFASQLQRTALRGGMHHGWGSAPRS